MNTVFYFSILGLLSFRVTRLLMTLQSPLSLPLPAATIDSSSSSSNIAVATSLSSTTDASAVVLPFDWYASPLFYDIIFQEDTPLETSMIRQIAKKFAVEGSPMKRIRIQPAEEEEEVEEDENMLSDAVQSLSVTTPVVASPSSSSPSSILPPLAVIRVLEPACGSARLMLSLLSSGRVDAPLGTESDGCGGVEWSCVGFDLSEGAVKFAQERWQERLQREKRRNLTSSSESTSTTPTVTLATAPPPFTVFAADMCHFSDELALHTQSNDASSATSAAATTTASPAIHDGFDLAHCLVSSLKHLLDPLDVAAHFIQMHKVLKTDGLYIIALHIHTLGGSSHFDRKVEYTNRDALINATTVTDLTSKADDTALPQRNSLASSSSFTVGAAAITPAVSFLDSDLKEETGKNTEEEIDDAFTCEYARGSTHFTADLITYAPHAASMTEKMIARVSAPKSADSTNVAAASPSSSIAATTAAAAVATPLQTDMLLRVYTLSSLHSLLCSLSPIFSLEATFSYADIYEEGWDASQEECQLSYPYPKPSVDQITTKNSNNRTNNISEAAATGPGNAEAASSSSSSNSPLLLPPSHQRNWNRVYPVSREVREQWDGVEAVVLVLRKVE